MCRVCPASACMHPKLSHIAPRPSFSETPVDCLKLTVRHVPLMATLAPTWAPLIFWSGNSIWMEENPACWSTFETLPLPCTIPARRDASHDFGDTGSVQSLKAPYRLVSVEGGEMFRGSAPVNKAQTCNFFGLAPKAVLEPLFRL